MTAYTVSLGYLENCISQTTRSIMAASKSRRTKKASKHSATSPPPLDLKNSSKTVVKRIKIAKFVEPDTISKESNETGLEDKDNDRPVIANVSNMVYTISQSCMIGE